MAECQKLILSYPYHIISYLQGLDLLKEGGLKEGRKVGGWIEVEVD